jgi:tRNA-Thr(GGU) m(6)t(6)A37 methyltransferase TsaA
MKIIYHPIGIVHSPFTRLKDMPIQPSSDLSAPGSVEIYPEFAAGLKDLDGFSHVILLYHFHEVRSHALHVVPFLDSEDRGIFATRAPTRPNPIGLSIVELLSVEGNVLKVDHLDILDGTPLLDLKPYVPEFDHRPEVRIGWLEHARARIKSAKSDDRFAA